MISIFRFIGILGLILITLGVVIKSSKRNSRNILFILGGISLLIYSIDIQDIIFIILQSVFTLAAVYDLIKHIKK